MYDIKYILGITAVLLTFIGYTPYIRDTIKGKTHPHVYSWFLWGLLTCIVFALQISDGAGIGAYVTLAAGIMCLTVFSFGLKNKDGRDITKIDTIFFVFAFISLGFWLILKQPIASAILITSIDLLGLAPTIRKSWNKPYSETLSFYILNILRFILTVASLQAYTIITSIYPVTWLFANTLFALMLFIRRKQLKNQIADTDSITR